MANSKKPNHRSGPKGPARLKITELNQARRRKKWLKKRGRLAAKRRFEESLRGPKVIHHKKNPGSNIQGHEPTDVHEIVFRNEDGTRSLHKVRVIGSDPEGYSPIPKDGHARIHFEVVGTGKKWSMGLNEFSFLFKPAA